MPGSVARRWAAVLGVFGLVWLWPPPAGVEPASWRLLAVFAATIAGLIFQPVPGGLVVLLGVTALPLVGALPIQSALAGYADPIVWLVLAAFLLSRGMIKTGLGRRIAYIFIRAIGHRSLGLGYALVGSEFVLASFIPSNAARNGGIIFPIAHSLARAYGSEPGPSARRLGAFLMVLLYQCECILCAIFLTGQASNPLIATFALQGAGFDLSYPRWLLGAIVPGLVSLAIVPPLIYRLFPPEVTHTPQASRLAEDELARLGPLKAGERLMLVVFALVAGLWMTTALHGVHYSLVALTGVACLLLARVLDWEDVLAERGAWDVFIWYGGLVRMAEALGETGLTRRFADLSGGLVGGWSWPVVLAALLVVYFFAHYGFASITSHSTAMYTPFLVVMVAAGAPAAMAALLLAYFSNLSACLTHYGTTPGPILFGAGYVSQAVWWRMGLVCVLPHFLVWGVLGPLWWKLLGWW
jgi:DASS family divalent anion:Na+ symporter